MKQVLGLLAASVVDAAFFFLVILTSILRSVGPCGAVVGLPIRLEMEPGGATFGVSRENFSTRARSYEENRYPTWQEGESSNLLS